MPLFSSFRAPVRRWCPGSTRRQGEGMRTPLYGYAPFPFQNTEKYRTLRGDLEELEGIAVRIAEVEHANDDTTT